MNIEGLRFQLVNRDRNLLFKTSVDLNFDKFTFDIESEIENNRTQIILRCEIVIREESVSESFDPAFITEVQNLNLTDSNDGLIIAKRVMLNPKSNIITKRVYGHQFDLIFDTKNDIVKVSDKLKTPLVSGIGFSQMMDFLTKSKAYNITVNYNGGLKIKAKNLMGNDVNELFQNWFNSCTNSNGVLIRVDRKFMWEEMNLLDVKTCKILSKVYHTRILRLPNNDITKYVQYQRWWFGWCDCGGKQIWENGSPKCNINDLIKDEIGTIEYGIWRYSFDWRWPEYEEEGGNCYVRYRYIRLIKSRL